ncbi:MAG: FAD-dependent oxidoreductase [Microbacteriaceae bacterium]
MEISRRAVIASGISAGLTFALAACATDGRATSANLSSTDSPGGATALYPRSFLRTSWSKDPFAHGSYSYLAPSDVGTDAREMLAEPIGRLHFAGEATSSTAPATTHGAWESGRRAAEEIVDSPGTVIVIGAGFAGLAAARELMNAGRDVIVLDARDHAGGRAHTVMLNGVPADLGPSWIHGVEGNPVVELARSAGVEVIPFDYDNQVGGNPVAEDFLDAVLEDAAATDDAEARPLSDLLPDELTAEQQWVIAVNVSGEFGADPSELSMAAPDEGADLRGGDALLNPGYSQIVDHVAQGLDIRLSWIVSHITYDESGVVVTADDGRELRSDHAVVTLPVGVLHAGSVTFTPPLNETKTRALDALQSGLLDKLWLEFDEVFWDEDVDVINWIDPDHPGHWPFWVNGYKIFGKPVLLGFNAGSVAREFSEKTDDELIASAMTAVATMKR